MTGATCKIEIGILYAERYPNLAMGETFKTNMTMLGETMNYPDPQESIGSSDIGNVSMVVPAIHEYLSITSQDVNSHSLEFMEAAGSRRADDVVLLAAKGLALTAYDILVDITLRERIRVEFSQISEKDAGI